MIEDHQQDHQQRKKRKRLLQSSEDKYWYRVYTNLGYTIIHASIVHSFSQDLLLREIFIESINKKIHECAMKEVEPLLNQNKIGSEKRKGGQLGIRNNLANCDNNDNDNQMDKDNFKEVEILGMKDIPQTYESNVSDHKLHELEKTISIG